MRHLTRMLLSITFIGAGSDALLAQIPLWKVDGTTPQAQAGRSSAIVGDIDFDGIDDVLIGSPVGAGVNPLAPLTASGAGRVLVVSGKHGTEITTYLGVQGAGDLFGYAVGGIGDIDLDGFVDVAIGAPRDDSPVNLDAGSVSVYSGASGVLRYRVLGLSASEAYGATIAGIGDTNFDGIPEILAAAPYADPSQKIDAGTARILFGASGFVAKSLNGANTLDHFGTALATLPGVTASASAPFIVGAPDALFGAAVRPGSATLYSAAGTLVATNYGSAEGDRFGGSFSTIDDVDGDGTTDFLIGAPGADTGLPDCGKVYIHSYGGGLISVVAGTQAGLGIGTKLARSSDLDGDGAPEIVDSTALGAVEFRPLIGPVLGSYSHAGDFGHSVLRIEDIDGDGRSDYLIGAPAASENEVDGSGRAGIWPGPAKSGLAAFSQSSLTFEVSAGGVTPSKMLTIANKGFGNVNYKLQKPVTASWLTLSKSGGTLTGLGDQDELEIALDVGKLTTADTSATITLLDATTNALYGELSVQVVSGGSGANPDLCVSITELHALSAIGGADPQGDVIFVTNCGNPALTLSYAAALVESDVDWLSVTPLQGALVPLGPAIPLSVSYDTSSLTAGIHTAHLRVANVANPSDFEDVTITLSLISSFLVPGQKGKGTISDAKDVDETLFFGVAGMEFVVTGGPKNGFLPRFTLIDPNGDTFDTWVPANNKTKKSLLLDTSGGWLLRVSGDGATGKYQFKTKRGFLPATAKSSTKTITATDAMPIQLDVLALPGCRLDMKVTPKTQPVGDLSFQFTLPSGAQFDAAQFDSIVNSTYTVKKLPLATLGLHRIAVNGLQVGKQMKVVLEPVQPAAGKGSVVLD